MPRRGEQTDGARDSLAATWVFRSLTDVDPDKGSPRSPLFPRYIDATWVDAVARRVAELMRGDGERLSGRLVDAATLAAELGVGRSWVYEHSDELGAVRLGGGTRPRLRFDIVAVRAAVAGERMKAPRSSVSRGAYPAPRGAYPARKRARLNREPAVGRVLSIRTRP
jgi:hypothetical protein